MKPEVKPETKPEVKPTTKPESKKDTESIMVKKESKTVNTGVRTATTLFGGLMGISMAVLGIVEILKRKK